MFLHSTGLQGIALINASIFAQPGWIAVPTYKLLKYPVPILMAGSMRLVFGN